VVDTVAPVAALAGGHIAGAALDVSDEPRLLPDSPLWGLPDVLLTRHKAGITEDSKLRMGQTVAEETLRLLAGGLPRPFCNPQVTARDRMRFPA
jgi:phosphoglycerate dehydrogenase-like enzyme